MSKNPIHEWSATETAAAIAAKRVSSEDVVRACLDRIAAREPVVGAWTWLDREQALGAARQRDREAPRGPLHGVPVGVKDIIDTADMPTGYGSRIYTQHRPAVDAACVALIKRAGGIVLGKTVTTEFAYFAPGKTANPHNPRHTPGGSSSGSAAAVADFMVPVALGTQTAASIIRPASFCGVVGFKPSFCTLAQTGIKPFSASFDTLGLFARDIDDAALLWAVLHGAREATLPAAAPPRIGLCRTPQWAEAQPESRTALDSAARALSAAGAPVEEVALPGHFADLVETHKAIMAFESARSFAPEYDQNRDALSPQLVALIEAGLSLSVKDYLSARRTMEAAKRDIAEITRHYDALIAPAAPGEAPQGLAATGDPVFSRMWTLLQIPAITLPVMCGPNDLPVGIQFLGAFGADATLLAIARWAAAHLG